MVTDDKRLTRRRQTGIDAKATAARMGMRTEPLDFWLECRICNLFNGNHRA